MKATGATGAEPQHGAGDKSQYFANLVFLSAVVTKMVPLEVP